MEERKEPRDKIIRENVEVGGIVINKEESKTNFQEKGKAYIRKTEIQEVRNFNQDAKEAKLGYIDGTKYC